jgi:hypothetical protein
MAKRDPWSRTARRRRIPLQLAQKQEVLEMLDVGKRLEYLDDATRRLEQSRPAAKP